MIIILALRCQPIFVLRNQNELVSRLFGVYLLISVGMVYSSLTLNLFVDSININYCLHVYPWVLMVRIKFRSQFEPTCKSTANIIWRQSFGIKCVLYVEPTNRANTSDLALISVILNLIFVRLTSFMESKQYVLLFHECNPADLIGGSRSCLPIEITWDNYYLRMGLNANILLYWILNSALFIKMEN